MTNQPTNPPHYPDGVYLWQYDAATNERIVDISSNVARVRLLAGTSPLSPTDLVGSGMTLTLLIPATNVIVEALTIYTILCGVDDNRIEAAKLLDKIKAVPREETR